MNDYDNEKERHHCGIAGDAWTGTFSGKVSDFLRLMLSEDVTYVNRKSCQSLNTPIMSLCPMYAAYTLLYRIKGSTCLVHGPIGCSMNRNIVSFLGGEIQYLAPEICDPSEHKAYTTNINEQDIIFGGEEKLFDAIVEITNRISPKVIWVFRTCPTSITGDDVTSVAARAQKKTGCTVKGINCEGLKNADWRKGYSLAYEKLLEMVKEPELKNDAVNIINMASVTRADMNEFDRVFSQMDIAPRYMPYYSSIDEIEKAAESSFNAVICGSGGNFFAGMMKEKFNMDYVSGLQPLGIGESRKWFGSIAEIAGKGKKVVSDEADSARREIEKYKELLNGKRAFIAGGAERVLAVLNFCIETGMKPIGISLYHCEKNTAFRLKEITDEYGADFQIFAGQNLHEQEMFLKETKVDLFLGNRMVNNRIIALNVPSMPLNNYGSTGPHLGFKGALSFASQMAKAVMSPRALILDKLAEYLNE